MRKSLMPQARQSERPNGLQWGLSPKAFEQWNHKLMAVASADNTISILDPIGFDPWSGEGVTAKRISAALRSIGAEKDVVVNLNSPGGDLVEGITIYNMLREHKGSVQIKVLGMAASAASIIAMAGDEILIAKSARMMIHDSWVIAIGNRIDLRLIADELEPFDHDMSDIYAARTKIEGKKVLEMMDAVTMMNGAAAIDQGFADNFLAADQVKEDPNASQGQFAAHILDMVLAKDGYPRAARKTILQDFKSYMQNAVGAGTQNATEDGTQNAVIAVDILQALKSFSVPT